MHTLTQKDKAEPLQIVHIFTNLRYGIFCTWLYPIDPVTSVSLEKKPQIR